MPDGGTKMTTATKPKEGDDEDAFTRDMALAQAEMANAVYNRVNPHFKSKYADYAAVREAVSPCFKYGFRYNFQYRLEYTPDGSQTINVLRLVVQHKSGKQEISERRIRDGTDQQEGSSSTYSKRYLLSSYFGIASDDDDDANAATQAQTARNVQANDRADAMLMAEMRKQISPEGLKQWGFENRERLADIPGARVEYKELMDRLTEDAEAVK